jgi:hypothetical protein
MATQMMASPFLSHHSILSDGVRPIFTMRTGPFDRSTEAEMERGLEADR